MASRVDNRLSLAAALRAASWRLALAIRVESDIVCLLWVYVCTVPVWTARGRADWGTTVGTDPPGPVCKLRKRGAWGVCSSYPCR